MSPYSAELQRLIAPGAWKVGVKLKNTPFTGQTSMILVLYKNGL